MNISFLKSLIISFGVHALAISLFLMDEKKFKKSVTSMTEIVILPSIENNNIKKKKTEKHEIIKVKDVKGKTSERKNLVSSVEKKKNENEFYEVPKANLSSNNYEKKKIDYSDSENKSFKSLITLKGH